MLHIAKRTTLLILITMLMVTMTLFMLADNSVTASEGDPTVTPTPVIQPLGDPGLCC